MKDFFFQIKKIANFSRKKIAIIDRKRKYAKMNKKEIISMSFEKENNLDKNVDNNKMRYDEKK